MVILEFKKETHDHAMSLVHNIKKEICELFEIMDKPDEAHGERKYYINAYDERRGGMGNRDMQMEERRNRDSRGRYSRRDDRFEDRRYPKYPFDERGGGRYNY